VRIPRATYRLQFHAGFTFRDARRLVPYLHALGITDCYASSYLKAVPGSLHGYDVADPTTLNPEVGSEQDYRAWIDALSAHGMSHILDIVPNHMGIASSANPWWQDVLENGPGSRYARYFDIEWHPIKRELENKVLLPILGDQYGTVLESQALQLACERGTFVLRYFEHTLPIAPKTFDQILSYRLPELVRTRGESDPDVQELESIITAVRRVPPREAEEPDLRTEREREKEVIKRRLAGLMRGSPPVRAFVDENVRLFNGTRGEPRSFDRLDTLLEGQAYRLAHWRVASEEINYRRFFDINELASLRMEDPEVFHDVHRFAIELVQRGDVTGLRVDHVDGVYDPGDYLRRLQIWARRVLETPAGDRPLYIGVEKILTGDEALPADWPVHGMTGYEFAAAVNGLFVDSRNEKAFDDIYGSIARGQPPFDELLYLNKKLTMLMSMAGDVHALGHQLNQFSEKNRHYRDFTLYSLTLAIREIIACFPVYRTYITGADAVRARDRAYIDQAVAAAKRRHPAMSPLVFDFVAALLLRDADFIPAEEKQEQRDFVRKFQQLSSPVTAKGLEDTTLYVYNRLISLNEVGADPRRFGRSPADVHDWMQTRQADWPHALSATSTHDSKRSEDVRARVNVLSEIPGAWKAAVGRWRALNRRHKVRVDRVPAPSANDEYLLYQTLVGIWPFDPIDDERFHDRIQRYMAKAIKEAKAHTSWVNPNEAYEAAMTRFVHAVLDRRRDNPFLNEFLPFQTRIAEHGIYNSLAQVVLKATAPGVPDFYQGSELWHLVVVDPDNRGPVDYERRERLLAEMEPEIEHADRRGSLARRLLEMRTDGRVKLFVTTMGLRCRNRHPEWFQQGEYVPLEATGLRRESVFAFARRHGGRHLLVVVPRLVTVLVPEADRPPIGQSVWSDTALPLPSGIAGCFTNVFTGARIEILEGAPLALSTVLAEFPVAILEQA
jgi:(1->4)-alpha-D-glucan 1-alpha-D-glucosylmutase